MFLMIRVKTNLLIHIHLPREEFLEAVQFFAKVLFDHSKQRNFKVLQLGLERGELSSLLQRAQDRWRRWEQPLNNDNARIRLHTSLHSNHPGRRTTMITAPVFSHRDFASCLSWTEKHRYCMRETHSACYLFQLVCDSLPPVVFSSAFSRTPWLARSGLVWNQSVTLLTSSAKCSITAFNSALTVDMSVDLRKSIKESRTL